MTFSTMPKPMEDRGLLSNSIADYTESNKKGRLEKVGLFYFRSCHRSVFFNNDFQWNYMERALLLLGVS